MATFINNKVYEPLAVRTLEQLISTFDECINLSMPLVDRSSTNKR